MISILSGIMKKLSSMTDAAKRNLSNVASRFRQSMHKDTSTQKATNTTETRSLIHRGESEEDDDDEIISFEDISIVSGSRNHVLNGFSDSSQPTFVSSSGSTVAGGVSTATSSSSTVHNKRL